MDHILSFTPRVLSIVGQEGCQSPLDMGGVIAIVVICTVLGLLWAIINVRLVHKIDVVGGRTG